MNTGYTTLTDKNITNIHELRGDMEKLRKRAEHLNEPERTLVRMYLDNNNSYRQLANLLGVSESTIARRLKRAFRRINSRNFTRITACKQSLEGKEKQIAHDHFISGLTCRQIARKHRMTYYMTRQTISKIKNLLHRNKKYQTTERSY